MYYSTTYLSPVALLTLACDGENLVGLWLEGQKYHGGSFSEVMTKKDDLPVFEAAKQWLDKYFLGENPDASSLPLRLVGSEFRQGVWRILQEIPYGKVVTYGNVARAMAEKLERETVSSRAVGGAIGHNPLSIIIPCHRVVGAKGSLTGYAGGVDTKRKLLALEGVDLSALTLPRSNAGKP